MKITRDTLLLVNGVRFDDISDLLELVPKLDSMGLVIQRMEVMRYTGEYEVPDIELSVIGADGDENWSEHQSTEIMNKLAKRKLDEAVDGGGRYCAKVWFED